MYLGGTNTMYTNEMELEQQQLHRQHTIALDMHVKHASAHVYTRITRVNREPLCRLYRQVD